MVILLHFIAWCALCTFTLAQYQIGFYSDDIFLYGGMPVMEDADITYGVLTEPSFFAVACQSLYGTGLAFALENATDYILELEEKVYKANKTSLELLKQLKGAENELETLKQYIIDLKHRIAVYIPVKDDQVDRRLAEFINNYPER